MSKRRLLSVACAVLGLVLVVSALRVTNAQDEPKFTPTYRSWTRTSGGYISDNSPFADKKANPAGIDFTGLHNTYANDKALAWYLGGKKGPAPDGSAIVTEFFTANAFVPGKVWLEDAQSKLKFTAWMFKDAEEYKDTGGWRWEAWVVDKDGKDAFFGGKALDTATQNAACVACHTNFKAPDLVIDTFTDVAHIKDYQAMMSSMGSGNMAATMAATKAK